ncbi:phosphatidylserine lipase ABHD16A [Folsomia candida]|uniref:phosphatidylserine lipase ABHD16A n=1 Tax=Folsomia candida TaxID=158441 RepID=UPI001604C401|nr:phosphatidylserine lipase ABHD16A [Folsomia candida]
MEEGGMRNKIMSSDGCEIDTIFLDRRGVKKTRVGRFLVLCLEGNQSYYEWGMNRTAIQAGYSVLGFNRPGFGESTGHPFPKFELNAAEAIMQYCQEVLGFDDNHIIIYAWSIGGFPGSYLSGQYPNIRGLIIDGSFEDVLPVVLNFVPRCLSILVRIMIRSQFDLRSSLELVRYHRPIRIFRRTRDAIMAHPPGEIATNRANMLLADVLLQRHPILMNNALAFAALTEWLSVPHIRGSTSILRKFYFYNTVMVTHFV